MLEGNDRSMVRDLAASGRIRLPMVIGAKAREDFSFVNATAPPPRGGGGGGGGSAGGQASRFSLRIYQTCQVMRLPPPAAGS